MPRLTALFAVLALAACSRPAAPVGPAPAALDPKIDALVEAALRDHQLVGATLLVAQHGRVIAKGYGLADVEHHVAAAPETVYRIASLTKQFTAVAILQQVERGRLALTDDLTKYLPDYPVHGITIEHLLTHTSGIANYTDDPALRALENTAIPRAALVARFASRPVERAPGERFAYSNSNYYLLGLILERLTGRSYADVIRDQVLLPAGMTASAYCAPGLPHAAAGYRLEAGAVKPAAPLEMSQPFAAGALCSTVGDLQAWQRALEAGVLIRRDTLARMRTPYKLRDGTASAYGYGVIIGNFSGHVRISHTGDIHGFASAMSRYPDDDLTVVVLSNVESRAASQLTTKISRLVLGIAEP